MKKILIIYLITLLSSCTTANFVKHNTKLKENHGILICSIHIAEPGWGINILKKGNSFASGIIKKLDSPWNLIMMTLEEGEYTYSNLFYPPVSINLESVYFNVKAGSVNYIGDLYIETNGNPYLEPDISFYYTDNEEKVLERSSSDYPNIINHFKYNKASILNYNKYKIHK